jgi:hypothetical protein
VPAAVDPDRAIEAVIPPAGTDRGVPHLFAIGTSEPLEPPAEIALTAIGLTATPATCR